MCGVWLEKAAGMAAHIAEALTVRWRQQRRTEDDCLPFAATKGPRIFRVEEKELFLMLWLMQRLSLIHI